MCIRDSRNADEILVNYENYSENQQVVSLYAEVIAKARISLMEKIEYLSQFDQCEICYCNVDSIHVSIPKAKYQEFMGYVSSLIGENMGMFKIEAEADSAIWFEPGRYFLFKDKKIVKSKNLGIPTTGGTFKTSINYPSYVVGNNITVPLNRTITISKIMRMRKNYNLPSSDYCVLKRWKISELPKKNNDIYTGIERINNQKLIKYLLNNIELR